MKMLDTSEGIVFESLDDDVLIAQYEENVYSTCGPTWTVRELVRRDWFDEEYRGPLYSDYATRWKA